MRTANKLLEKIETTINRFSPMENFEVKEDCARAILRVIERAVQTIDWGKVADDGHTILIAKADVLALLKPNKKHE